MSGMTEVAMECVSARLMLIRERPDDERDRIEERMLEQCLAHLSAEAYDWEGMEEDMESNGLAPGTFADILERHAINNPATKIKYIMRDLLESYRDGALHTWGKSACEDDERTFIDAEIEKIEESLGDRL
jgi:hypothetical protein